MALTVVEDKIRDVSSLVTKTDNDTEISDHNHDTEVIDHNHNKYITTLEFNILAARVFTARLAQANFVTRADFDT